VWNEEGAAIRLVVHPPWWWTRWAILAYALLLIGGVAGLVRFEKMRERERGRVVEAELRATAAELQTRTVEAETRALKAENDRKSRELEEARKLQVSMLPREVPRHPRYAVAARMRTATEVGGDYYDFHLADDHTLNIAFGDATGHGMQAGTIVTLMKGLFLSDASRFEITEFFNRCSRAIKQIRLGRLFMAFTFVRLRGESLSLSSAGMPPAYLHRRATGCAEEILLKGMPLGAMKNFPYLLHETEMQPGDVLLLLTDGLPEQKNAAAEIFDYTRVQEIFDRSATAAPDEIIASLVREGESWMQGAVQEDDITLLVIRRKDEA
jgi:serine phosphatase RsbU (regulator of sigma subunit)